MRRRVFPTLHVLGMIVLGFGLSMLAPLLLSELTRDGAQSAYNEAALITLGTGLLLWLVGHPWRRELKTRDGILLVVLAWTLLPGFAALPLLIHMPGLSVADAYFEAMSGLTATGATVLSGLDALPHSINLWRAQLHWIGGLGVIVLVTAVLPLLGVGGRQMFKAETPTPMKEQKLTPRMAETAKSLWAVYVLLTLACIGVLRALGMSLFDAVVHAFSIMGLGAFSSHDASLGYFDSLPLEIAVAVFALLASINFTTHFAFLRGRALGSYRHDPEVRWLLGFVLGSGVVLALLLWQRDVFLDFPSALRYALFNTISVATTLGFSTTDYGHWPFFAGLWLLFLCSFSSSAGSTGGGIKMLRAILLYKQEYRELNKLLHPNARIPLRLGEEVVPNKIVYAVLAFLFVYVAAIVSLSFVLSFTGLDILTAFSAIVACINNTGPGLGEVGPAHTYAVLNDFQIMVCAFAMLLGRLELFTLLVVLTPAFWRK
ncbi:MAG: potassium transporter Trk [Hydrogenophilales bacterium CG_4_9_14_3_um_filter_63_34]|nr:MAG: potassium transporter Trk [Hydrogenophilales bacterium CG_4_10_14_3_um_filter_63_21]PJB06823.1 MAG: potassium transporter Trk [Hydrogenophilales bacterium CG_4_9_14_3_um_filter_63_34]